MMSGSYLLLSLTLPALIQAQNSSPEDSGSSSGWTASHPSSNVNNEAGASGSSSGYNLSKGGVIAIIVACVIVAAIGIASAVLFYMAKKRQWEVRKTIKHASKRIVSKVNPRQSRAQSRPRGMVRMDSPSRKRDIDLEKGADPKSHVKTDRTSKRQAMQIDDTQAKPASDRKHFKTVLPDSWTVGGRR